MRFFDSHCHPQFPQYESDRDEMLERALKGGVFLLCVGTDLKTSQQAIELAQKYERIWAAAGLHPTDVNNELGIMNYEELINKDKIVAIGEVGLDYYRIKNSESQIKQREIFEKFLDLAIKYDKPVILHCREAHQDMLKILNSRFVIPNSNLQGVIHSFTGTVEEAGKYMDLGFCLGFNGIITFTNQYDESVRYAPLEKILLETDAPFLAPVPFRGKRNEPLYVKQVAEKIAELKGLGYNQVAEKTFENTKELFGIKI